jgi:dihydrofolate reductase
LHHKRDAFSFVIDGAEPAVARARAAAGDKKVSVMGATFPQQTINAGLVDEIQIHLVPVLLGKGKRLFDHLDAGHITLERTRTRVVESPDGLTPLRFRVRR